MLGFLGCVWRRWPAACRGLQATRVAFAEDSLQLKEQVRPCALIAPWWPQAFRGRSGALAAFRRAK